MNQVLSIEPMALDVSLPPFTLSPVGRIPKKQGRDESSYAYQQRLKKYKCEVDPTELMEELRDLIEARTKARTQAQEALQRYHQASNAVTQLMRRKVKVELTQLKELEATMCEAIQHELYVESRCQTTYQQVNHILKENAPKSLQPESQVHYHPQHHGTGYAPGPKEACVCCQFVEMLSTPRRASP